MAMGGVAAGEVCQDCGGGGGGGGGGVVNRAPAASFTVSANEVFRNVDVTVDGSGSSDPDGSITAWAYDWTDDGVFDWGASTGAISFGTLGTKTIRLRVTDNKGATAETTRTVTVVNRAPVGQVDCGEWLEQGQTTTCKAFKPSDGDGQITAYAWDLDEDGLFDDGTGPVVAWAPTEIGTHRPKLRIKDNEGAVTEVTGTTTVWAPQQSAVPFEVSDAVAGKPVAFTAAWGAGEEHDGWTYVRDWRFGDAEGTRGPSQQNGRITTFTFAKPGTYTVKLRQISDATSWDPRTWTERSQTVVVQAPVKPQPQPQPQGGGGAPDGGGQQGAPAPQGPAAGQVVTAAAATVPAATATSTASKTTAAKTKKRAPAKRCSTRKARKGKAKSTKAKASAKKRAATCTKAKKQRKTAKRR
jgi:hypothetical protein